MAAAALGAHFVHETLGAENGVARGPQSPWEYAWKASSATCKEWETDLGTLVLVPLAERRVLGPDAGVQARVPVQVTENRPIGTCTAYPGLLERGHGLRQGFGPLLAPVASFPQERVFDPSPGALGYHRTVWREAEGAGLAPSRMVWP